MDSKITQVEGIGVVDLINQFREVITQEIQKVLNNQSEKYLSPKEVCALFVPNISRQTLANWTKKGLLNKYVIGGRPFYLGSEIKNASVQIRKYKSLQLDKY